MDTIETGDHAAAATSAPMAVRMVRAVPERSECVRVSRAGDAFLVWDVADAAWLRRVARLAINPIGACLTKSATRGKAAAVPIQLSPEELYVCVKNRWVRVYEAPSADAPLAPPREVDAWEEILRPLGERDAGHRRHRAVMYDLWERGYRCTSGLRFGVDYLAYTADPSMLHAQYMVIVARKGELIAPLDLVTRARVATSALKVCVIAYADDSPAAHAELSTRAEVTYAAFRRMGPGSAVFVSTSSMLDRAQAAMAAAAQASSEVTMAEATTA